MNCMAQVVSHSPVSATDPTPRTAEAPPHSGSQSVSQRASQREGPRTKGDKSPDYYSSSATGEALGEQQEMNGPESIMPAISIVTGREIIYT